MLRNVPFKSINCDVSSYDEVKRVAQAIKRDGKRVSGLINAAGIASMNLAVTTPPEIAEKIIKTNLLGTIYCCQLLSPMIFQTQERLHHQFFHNSRCIGLKRRINLRCFKGGR